MNKLQIAYNGVAKGMFHRVRNSIKAGMAGVSLIPLASMGARNKRTSGR